jgi:hypothetical protein
MLGIPYAYTPDDTIFLNSNPPAGEIPSPGMVVIHGRSDQIFAIASDGEAVPLFLKVEDLASSGLNEIAKQDYKAYYDEMIKEEESTEAIVHQVSEHDFSKGEFCSNCGAHRERKDQLTCIT